MTEAEARAVLRAFVGVGGLEPWIEERRWEAVLGGWRVREQERERVHGWRFRVEPVAGGLSVVMSARGRAGGVRPEPAGAAMRLAPRRLRPVSH
jgi:hypothetical protein